MKTDDLLYEAMQDIDVKEADMLERQLIALQSNQDFVLKQRLSEQEQLTLDKIHEDMKTKGKQGNTKKRFSKKRLVLLLAATIMMLGMATFAKTEDWDIEMAEMLGLSSVMEELEGGYVKIGVSDTSENVTITASQSIGDRNSMWLQLDSDIPWTVEEGGYYLFENTEFCCYNRSDYPLTGGTTMHSFNNNGYVSFVWRFEDYNNINRATMEIRADKVLEYKPLMSEEDEEISTVISNGTWEFKWQNYYAPNTITRHPFKKVTCKAGEEEMACIITEVEVSPVSIQIKGWKSPLVNSHGNLEFLEAVKLKDGTVIPCESIIQGESNFEVSCYLTLDFAPGIDMSEIEYVTIGGTDIRIDV